MKRLVGILGCLLGACATAPRTTQEVRDGVKGGAAFTRWEERQVHRPFSIVLNDVRSNADRCLNQDARLGGAGPYGSWGVVHFSSSTSQTSARTGEMVVQGRGAYLLLADVEAAAPKETRVTVYGPSASGYKDLFDAVFQWAQGKAQECPTL